MARFPFREDLLQFIWANQLFDQRGLRTVDGHVVEILKPGRTNTDSGPDFLDARIRIHGQLWAGNVEIHLRSCEWAAHGHHTDPAYENVVLHVVFEHDLEMYTLNGTRLPTVRLADRIDPESLAIYERLMHDQAWVPCAPYIAHVDLAKVPIWLERVLVERLERKCAEVEVIYRRLERDPAATFYHCLLRGFGFRTNAEPFGMLAQALPLKVLLKYRDDPFRTEALLFGQAGLLPTDFLDDHPRALQAEHRLLAALHGLKPAPLAAWRFGGSRPSNFPTVRLAQLAVLLARVDGSFSALLQEDDPQRLASFLHVEAAGYWLTHYRFDAATKASPKRLGKEAIRGLIINTIVPYLFAMGRVQGDPAFAQRALALLERMPPERNNVLEKWESLGLRADSAARSQALIELKRLYCEQRRCLHCVIGADLLKRPKP